MPCAESRQNCVGLLHVHRNQQPCLPPHHQRHLNTNRCPSNPRPAQQNKKQDQRQSRFLPIRLFTVRPAHSRARLQVLGLRHLRETDGIRALRRSFTANLARPFVPATCWGAIPSCHSLLRVFLPASEHNKSPGRFRLSASPSCKTRLCPSSSKQSLSTTIHSLPPSCTYPFSVLSALLFRSPSAHLHAQPHHTCHHNDSQAKQYPTVETSIHACTPRRCRRLACRNLL